MILHTAQGVCECAHCTTKIDIGDKVLEEDGRLFCCRGCLDSWELCASAALRFAANWHTDGDGEYNDDPPVWDVQGGL